MKNDFIDFVTQLFPSINPYTKKQVKESIKQFETEGRMLKYTMHSPLSHLAQGDIFGEEIPFVRQDSEGNLGSFRTKAILLSNTCDSERDDLLIFAALIPLSSLSESLRETIKQNKIYRYLYIPDSIISDYVIDFSLLNSFSRELFNRKLDDKVFTKTLSLNDLGYYMFLCKLTIHLMRPEDADVQSDRQETA